MSSWQTAFRHLSLFNYFWRQIASECIRGCSLRLRAMAFQCQAVIAQRRPTVLRGGGGGAQGRNSPWDRKKDTTDGMQVAGKRHCRLAGGQRRKSKLSKYMALMANPIRLWPRSGAQQRDTQAVLKNQARNGWGARGTMISWA